MKSKLAKNGFRPQRLTGECFHVLRDIFGESNRLRLDRHTGRNAERKMDDETSHAPLPCLMYNEPPQLNESLSTRFCGRTRVLRRIKCFYFLLFLSFQFISNFALPLREIWFADRVKKKRTTNKNT